MLVDLGQLCAVLSHKLNDLGPVWGFTCRISEAGTPTQTSTIEAVINTKRLVLVFIVLADRSDRSNWVGSVGSVGSDVSTLTSTLRLFFSKLCIAPLCEKWLKLVALVLTGGGDRKVISEHYHLWTLSEG